MRSTIKLLAALLPATLLAREPLPPPAMPELVIREVRYDATLSDKEARFAVELDAESLGKGEASAPLFEGDVAVLPPDPKTQKLPADTRLARAGNQYRLVMAKPGRVKLKLNLVAKITRAEPWNTVTFTGPVAAIASIAAQVPGDGVELQLLSGTATEPQAKGGPAKIRGVLGADRTVSLRWQTKAAEAARKALVTCETSTGIQITPTVVKLTTRLRYDIVQGNVPKLTLTLPAAQALTRLQGDQIRDWQIKTEGNHQLLTIEPIKPLEKSYSLTLFTEQPVETTPAALSLAPPQPLEVARETGTLSLSAEDMLVETDAATGLRQVNAPGGALAAYEFYGRPATLALKLRRIEPVVNVATRVTARLEESRLLVTHALTLNVEKAGIYAVELAPLGNFLVSDVRGDGIEDWKATGGKLVVNFAGRVLGQRAIEVQLEQAQKTVPEQLALAPLRVAGATKETAQIGVAAAPGFRLKTAKQTGLREVPVTTLDMGGIALGYTAEQPDWQLTVAVERLAARLLADIFNLVTIGDGLVGGSATVRYAILNQGVQEFRLRLPSHWKNVEFTAPGIRRKDQQKDDKGEVWTIALQDKVWGSFTLVITYDAQFDPHKATLAVGGVHALDIERETGTVAITSAANLQLKEKTASEPLHRVDESELAESDRALISRPVLLAYRYPAGEAYTLAVEVMRFEEQAVLQAVTDRTQLTTVLTDAGQMLTQASFMVKNNAKQFQRFTLPKGADFWSCFVAGQAAKPERDGDALLVPLPRGVDRDQAFPVDIVYAQKTGDLKSWTPRSVALEAPRTDVQTTYAEWELYVPKTHTLASFGGNMTVARGTTYGLRDAWEKFVKFYEELLDEAAVLVAFGIVAFFITVFVVAAARRGWRGALVVLSLGFVGILVIGLMISALGTKTARTFDNIQAQMTAQPPAGAAGEHTSDARADQLRERRKFEESAGRRVTPHAAAKPRAITVAPAAPPAAMAPAPEAVMPPLALGGGSGVLTYSGGTVISGGALAVGAAPATPEGLAFGAVAGGGGAAPAVAGIRPIRVDIPREGDRFAFTKVLNVHGEPLSAKAWALKSDVRNVALGTVELIAFLAGALMIRRQLRRGRASSLWLTIGLALVLASVGGLLIVLRLLHVAFILVVPVLSVMLLVWLAKKYIPRKTPPPTAPPAPPRPPMIPPPVPPAATALLARAVVASAAAAQQHAQQPPAQQVEFQIQSAQYSNTPILQSPIPSSPRVAITSATYTGDIREKLALFEAVLELAAADAGQRVALFGGDVAVQEFSATAKDARLSRDGGWLSVTLPKRGTTTVRVKFVAKVTGDAASRKIAFAVPPALTSKLVAKLDDADAAVELPAAVSLKTTAEQQQMRVEAVLGAATRVEMSWTPRMKRAAEVAATVFCQNTTLAGFGGGVLNTRATLSLQVAQGELRQARVRLPAGQRLLKVEGEGIRTWDIAGSGDIPVAGSGSGNAAVGKPPLPASVGAQVLTVELLKG
ncbi:MAG: hypothetical protein HZA91_09570, partial [Verrucomicrobia bacterium]|nr:hypothetical protein [Verrucomicrobiota bacterium]